ncbi:hypothetical protein SNE26_19485 [Mucilaginibacter sp. cycad4]|uniref:hypothetical protein n=1 Tax=Mucilaginibacter sp. cycad4 TaxID=3342096 RepID=UPI002AAC37D3|nr:hypothetical protein [Mucilaginibacter gossypii]WPU98209.1 hypothetical protein SNE26_19485 [Mucilaginibacter gossypii]
MAQLTQYYSHSNLNNSLIRIGDLVNLDGPVLSLFEDVRNGYLYLFDWVDRIEQYNRWIIFQIRSKDILEFIQKRITYLQLFQNAVRGTYYFTDIANNNINNYKINHLETVPDKYYPNKNDYFDKADCPSFDKIVLFLLNKKQENIYLSNASVFLINSHRTRTRVDNRKKSRTLIEKTLNSDSFRLIFLSVNDSHKSKYDVAAVTSIKKSKFNLKKHA